MNAQTPLWPARPTLLAGSLLLALASCTNTAAPPAATAPPDPGLPDDALVALVHGEVSSPIHDELEKTLRMVPYDGSQKAADHDVLIFDGDAHDPAEHAKHPLVDEALRAGTWVLGVDLDEAHKRDSLGERLGAAPRGASHSYLVRTEADAQGRPSVWIVDAPVDAEAPQRTGETTRTGPVAPSALGSEDAAAFADTITAQLGKTVSLSSKLTAQQNSFPDGLLYKTISYTPQLQNVQLKASKNPGTVQTTGTELAYVFHVFINDLNGDFQVVTAEVEMQSRPTDEPDTFACWGCYKGLASLGTPDEYAWFLTRQTVEMSPVAADRPLLSMIASAPAHSSADVDAYTSALEVPVEYTGQREPFVYKSSGTNGLGGWRLNSNVLDPGVVASWEFESVDPWDADTNFDDDDNPGWDGNGYPREPNDISQNGLGVYGQAAWKTTALLYQTVSFSLKNEQQLADVYCNLDGIKWGCLYASDADFAKGPGLNQVFDIDLGALIRNPVTLTFPETTVEVGTIPVKITGTVTLTEEAKEDTYLDLSSDSANLTVDKVIGVAEGQKTATFDAFADARGLNPGGSTTAKVTASSASTGAASATLTVTRKQ